MRASERVRAEERRSRSRNHHMRVGSVSHDQGKPRKKTIYDFPGGRPGASTGTSPAVLAYQDRDLRSPKRLPEIIYVARRGPKVAF